MGRQLRPGLPGTIFHITARTQWQEPLFRGAEEQVSKLIRGSVDHSDARLLAYAVMANHIHVVVLQGRRPLSEYMQPLLRRIALLVNQSQPRQGHVFCGRYRHTVCLDPDYFRSMVTYVHLNPVRAGICDRPDQYRWTSHRDYARSSLSTLPTAYALAVEDAVRVFAASSDQPLRGCRRDYRRHVRWRLSMDAYLAAEADSWQPIPRSCGSPGGDLHWYRTFSTPSAMRLSLSRQPSSRTTDLRDYVQRVLDDVAPDLPLQLLRCGGRTRDLVRVRRAVIARALGAGYTGSRVALFLNVSPSTVSGVRAALRGAA